MVLNNQEVKEERESKENTLSQRKMRNTTYQNLKDKRISKKDGYTDKCPKKKDLKRTTFEGFYTTKNYKKNNKAQTWQKEGNTKDRAETNDSDTRKSREKTNKELFI